MPDITLLAVMLLDAKHQLFKNETHHWPIQERNQSLANSRKKPITGHFKKKKKKTINSSRYNWSYIYVCYIYAVSQKNLTEIQNPVQANLDENQLKNQLIHLSCNYDCL